MVRKTNNLISFPVVALYHARIYFILSNFLYGFFFFGVSAVGLSTGMFSFISFLRFITLHLH